MSLKAPNGKYQAWIKLTNGQLSSVERDHFSRYLSDITGGTVRKSGNLVGFDGYKLHTIGGGIAPLGGELIAQYRAEIEDARLNAKPVTKAISAIEIDDDPVPR
ncbi:hypothetical protein D3C78_1663740 [compost metagenome]